MDILKKLGDYIKTRMDGPNRKKTVENAAIIVIIGIILIIAGGALLRRDDGEEQKKNAAGAGSAETVNANSAGEGKYDIETRLESILSQIDGAGRVNVMITYVAGKEIVPAYDVKRKENETREKDGGGGTRDISEHDYESSIVYEDTAGNGKKPVIIKDIQPVVRGVVVVAEGASKPEVKEDITKAVQVLMDIPIHKVQVLEMRR